MISFRVSLRHTKRNFGQMTDCMARGRLSVELIAKFSEEIQQNCIKTSKNIYKCIVGLQGFFESI